MTIFICEEGIPPPAGPSAEPPVIYQVLALALMMFVGALMLLSPAPSPKGVPC